MCYHDVLSAQGKTTGYTFAIYDKTKNSCGNPPVNFSIPAPDMIGWREWVALPELGIPAIKAKIDSGARTSALHAFRIEPFTENNTQYVRFWLRPLRKNRKIELECVAPLVEMRNVKDSGGHVEERYVIQSSISVGGKSWNIQITLTSRDDMIFRMLLGRTAIQDGKFIIDPSASYVCGRGMGKVYRKKKSERSHK